MSEAPTTTTVARRGEVLPMTGIPPRLAEAGVRVIERDGYRTIGFPPELRQHYNVIFPTVELSQVNPNFHPVVREIRLSLETDAYAGAGHHKQDECSLNKLGLYKLAEAAKIDIATERINSQNLAATERLAWRAVARQRHSDGTTTTFTGSASFDNEAEHDEILAQVKTAISFDKERNQKRLRFTNAEQVEAEVDKRWRQKTRKASELTETIAIERATRGILKLPHTMKQAQFEKPWAVVCFALIPTTPEARAEEARAIGRLYGGDVDVSPGQPLVISTTEVYELPPGADPEYDGDDTGPADQGDATGGLLDAPEEGIGGASASPSADDEPSLEEPAPTETPSPEPGEVTAATQKLAKKAEKRKPPIGSYQNMTLAQIAGKGEKGLGWLRWALKRAWPPEDAEFAAELAAFCAVYLPSLLDAETP